VQCRFDHPEPDPMPRGCVSAAPCMAAR
jgi:hypothetical protein